MVHHFAREVGLCAVVLASAALLCPVSASAQATGRIRGTVVDGDGFELPRARVVLRSEALIGGEQVRRTDDRGVYVFTDLAPGSYTLDVSFPGFRPVRIPDVRVGSEGEARVRTALSEPDAGGTGTILVEDQATPVVDPTDATIQTRFTREQLQRLPVGRNEHAVPALTPGVHGGANPIAAGAASNETTRIIDGQVVTDPVSGTFGTNFVYDGIRELRVQLGGFMPEHGQSLGAAIEIVTESGSNNLEVDLAAFAMDGSWRPRKDARFAADGLQVAPTDFDSTFRTTQIAARVSGPIVKDRAWFFLNTQHSRSRIANTGIPVPRDYDGHHLFAKLTAQPDSTHRLTASLTSSPATIDNTLQGSPFILPEAQARQAQSGYVAMGRWQWFFSDKLNLDTQVLAQRIALEIGGVPCTHDVDLGYNPCRPGEREGSEDWWRPGRVGQLGAFSSVAYGQFAFDHRMRYQASTRFSAINVRDPLGLAHDLKFGVETSQTTWTQLQGRTGNVLYGDINAVGWDPSTFANWYRVEVSGPLRFATRGSQWSAFAQDSWRVRRNVVLKGGVRYDAAVLRNDVGEPVVAQSVWGPRIYGAWDPTDDGKTKIAGGYGRFYDTGRLAVAAFTSQAALGSKLWIGEVGGGGDLTSQQSTVYQIQPRANPAIAHDKMRAPRTDELSLQVQRQIQRNMALAGQLQIKRTTSLFEFDERNLVYDEDGSAVIGARDGNTLVPNPRMRTPVLARRDFVQWNTNLTRQFAKRWFMDLNYTWAMSWGTSPQSLSGAFANAPQTQFNYGPLLQSDIRHSATAYGAWELPLDPFPPSIGFTLSYRSGLPLERLYPTDEPPPGGAWALRIRERGVYTRTPDMWDLGLRVAQAVQLRSGRLELEAQLLNALNNRAPVSFLQTLYTDDRLLTAARQDPLRVQLGVRALY